MQSSSQQTSREATNTLNGAVVVEVLDNALVGLAQSLVVVADTVGNGFSKSFFLDPAQNRAEFPRCPHEGSDLRRRLRRTRSGDHATVALVCFLLGTNTKAGCSGDI